MTNREIGHGVLRWVVLILMGPLNFGFELVGPAGNVAWRQLVAGVVGTWLYVLAANAYFGFL